MTVLELTELKPLDMPRLPSRKWMIVFGAILIAIAGYAASLYFTHNYHAVVAGEVYRAAQIPSDELVTYKTRDGIRTILNLRGASPQKPWYTAEVSAAKGLGISHIDFKMSSDEQLDDKKIAELVKIMKDAPKPLLIHCESGANRTGLAAALYLASIKKESIAVASQQLSIRYGHFGIPLSPTYAMDETFERFSNGKTAHVEKH